MLILKQQMTCSRQSDSPVCLFKHPRGYPGNPKSKCSANKLRIMPHSSDSVHMSFGLSLQAKRMQPPCEDVKEFVLCPIPDSSSGQPVLTVLIRKLGRMHPHTSAP